MRLSKRLQAVADCVSDSSKCVADIGCDHGYVSIYLVKNKKIAQVIAMDVNKGPLERAKENIKKYGCEDQIITRLSDGAMALESGEVDAILMAGMGGGLMIKILDQSRERVEQIDELILQPQSEIDQVRLYLHKLGFCIRQEIMLKEDGKYYTVMRATKGKERYEKEEYYRYGKDLLETKNVVLKEYLEYALIKCEAILEGLLSSGKRTEDLAYQKVASDYQYIKTALGYYQKGDVYGRECEGNGQSER